jgi:hypothetical protein
VRPNQEVLQIEVSDSDEEKKIQEEPPFKPTKVNTLLFEEYEGDSDIVR